MKPFLTTLAAAVLLLVPAGAAEPQKPLVTLTVKRQTLDSDHDLRGRRGDTNRKTIALRVEVTNTSQAPVGESALSGDVLVKRITNEQEEIVKEPLDRIKVPAMKPGERLILHLGKIQLSEVEWRKHKFEETLEEWQVTSTLGSAEIGKAVSSDRFETLLEEVVPAPSKPERVRPLHKALRRQAE